MQQFTPSDADSHIWIPQDRAEVIVRIRHGLHYARRGPGCLLRRPGRPGWRGGARAEDRGWFPPRTTRRFRSSRMWWQVPGSNKRRLSRRFTDRLALPLPMVAKLPTLPEYPREYPVLPHVVCSWAIRRAAAAAVAGHDDLHRAAVPSRPIIWCRSLISYGWRRLPTWPGSRAPPATTPSLTCAATWPGALNAAWTPGRPAPAQPGDKEPSSAGPTGADTHFSRSRPSAPGARAGHPAHWYAVP